MYTYDIYTYVTCMCIYHMYTYEGPRTPTTPTLSATSRDRAQANRSVRVRRDSTVTRSRGLNLRMSHLSVSWRWLSQTPNPKALSKPFLRGISDTDPGGP